MSSVEVRVRVRGRGRGRGRVRGKYLLCLVAVYGECRPAVHTQILREGVAPIVGTAIVSIVIVSTAIVSVDPS